MNTAYIVIKEDMVNNSQDIEGDKPGIVERIISRIVPKGNPDFEHLYSHVRYWYLEIDNSRPLREIGFDDGGNAIVIGPYGKNYGVWTDSPILIDYLQYESVSKDDFITIWNTMTKQFSTSDNPNDAS